MGTKFAYQQLQGFLVPHRWNATLAADRALGTDYTEADPQYGAATWGGSTATTLAVEVSGTPDSGVTSLKVRPVTAGGPDGSAGVAWSSDGGTTYYGRDLHTLTTGYQRVRDEGRHPGIVTLSATGEAWMIWYEEISASSWGYRVAARTTAGVWSAGSPITVRSVAIGGHTYTACDLAEAPDGSLLAAVAVPARTGGTWQIDLYRSETGASWSQAARALGGWSDATPPRAIRFAFDLAGGAGLMLVSYDVGGNFTTIQYYTSDGGATWTAPDATGVAYIVAHDVAFAAGNFVALVNNIDLTPDQWQVYRVGSAASDMLASTAVALTGGSPLPTDEGGGCIVADERGVIRVYVTDDTTESIAAYTSIDGGRSFALAGFGELVIDASGTSATIPGAGLTGTLQRGTVVLVSSAWDGSAVSGGMYELRIGGASNVTPSTDIDGWKFFYVPTDSLVNYGWTATDTGAPTITLSEETGQSIACGAGDSASRRYTVSAAASSHAVWATTCLRVTAGAARITVSAPDREILVDVTSTQIRAYDSAGAAGSYTNHNAATYVEVFVAVEAATATGTVWYRAVDRSTPGERRTFTELATITGLGASTAEIRHWITWPASTTALVLWAGVQWTDNASPRLTSGQEVADLQPLALGAGSPSYAGVGASIRGLGGTTYPSTSAYTSAVTSPYARGNVDPRIAPNPRVAWRSTGSAASPLATTTRLRHTLVPDTSATAQYLGSEVWGILADGLVGVPIVKVVTAGGTVATLDLRQPLTYQAAGDSVRPTSAAGTAVQRPWVAPDELVGGYFEYSNGDVRRIISNTAGSLTDTGTPAEVRATIYVEGIDGGEATSGAGYIWPSRALVLWYLRGAHTVIQEYVELQIESTTAIGPEGYREIGTLAIGRVQLLRGLDRSEAVAQDSGYERQELPDRSTTRTRQGPVKRRVELSLVDTHVDVQQHRGASTSPDYGAASDNASAYPGVDRHADPLVLQGLVREVDGVPIVWLPQIPVDPGTGSGAGADLVVCTRSLAYGAVYGYITELGRREQLPVGRTGVNDAYRYSTLVIEEEV